ncbi:formylglycine-generating enzyme family protein, partial [Achromobacter denitrificans]
MPLPEVLRLPAGEVSYRPPGEALRAGQPVTPAPLTARYPRGVSIMKRQVSQAEYAACVRAGGCKPLDAAQRDAAAPDLPAVGISWTDASAYAAWLSGGTGQRWRLPTYAEWVYAAGAAYREELPLPDGDDPAQRWLAEYDAQSRRGQEDVEVRPFGAFGVNDRGLL